MDDSRCSMMIIMIGHEQPHVQTVDIVGYKWGISPTLQCYKVFDDFFHIFTVKGLFTGDFQMLTVLTSGCHHHQWDASENHCPSPVFFLGHNLH